MPRYLQFAQDLEFARNVHRQDPDFLAAYEDDYLKNLTLALNEIESAHGMLTPANRAALTRRALPNYYFAEDFKKLNDAGILIQPVFDLLIAHLRHSSQLTKACLILHSGGQLLLPGNLTCLAQKPQFAPELAQAFLALDRAKIFNPNTRALVLQYPQLIPALLILDQNNLLNKVTFRDLLNYLPHINGFTEVLKELALANHLNKDSYLEARKVGARAEACGFAMSQLRQIGRLKDNFPALIQNLEHIESLGSAFFDFVYGETPLSQKDLNLLFQFAAHAKPLSGVMLTLGHMNLLETYRPALARSGEQSEKILALFDWLRPKGLLKPENIAALFQAIPSLDTILQVCQEQNPKTGEAFRALVGRVQAERRIALLLGSSGLNAGGPGPQLFGERQAVVGRAEERELGQQLRL